MDATEQAGGQVGLKYAGGNPRIGGMKRGCKGMRGKVETPPLKIIPHLFEHKAAKVDLFGGVKRLCEQAGIGLNRRILYLTEQAN